MPHLGPTELIIILVIVLAIFGAGKLSTLGGALGKGVKDFRAAMGGDDKNAGKDGGSSELQAAKVSEPTGTSQEGSDQEA
jgi:sec-independent protein translocase protein TatA